MSAAAQDADLAAMCAAADRRRIGWDTCVREGVTRWNVASACVC